MAGLPFDQRDGHIWMNGEFVEWSEAKLHVLSHGLHYGSGVFEGERAYGGDARKGRRVGRRRSRRHGKSGPNPRQSLGPFSRRAPLGPFGRLVPTITIG